MKIKNLLSVFISSALVSGAFLSFNSNAMLEEDTKTAGSAVPAVSTSSAQSQVQSARLEDMMLVHLTKYCPQNNTMIPGSVPRIAGINLSNEQTLNIARKLPPIRITLHWTINGIMPPHDTSVGRVDRTNYPYAVMVPMSSLTQQILGGTQADIYTIGNVSLDRNSIIIMSKDDPMSREGMQSRVMLFDPSTQKIEDVINHVLRQEGKPLIKVIPDQKFKVKAEDLNLVTEENYLHTLRRYRKGWVEDGSTLHEAFKIFSDSVKKGELGKLFDDDLEHINVNGVHVCGKDYFSQIFSDNNWEYYSHGVSFIGYLDYEVLTNLFEGVRYAIMMCELNKNYELGYTLRHLMALHSQYETSLTQKKVLFGKLMEELQSRRASPIIVGTVREWEKVVDSWIRFAVTPAMESIKTYKNILVRSTTCMQAMMSGKPLPVDKKTMAEDMKALTEKVPLFMDGSTSKKLMDLKKRLDIIIQLIQKDKDPKVSVPGAAAAAGSAQA